MRNRWLGACVAIGALAWVLPFAAPVAFADDEPGQTETTAALTKPDKPKLICKREAATGSAIPKRTCRTQQQIDVQRQSAKENMDRVNDGQTGRSSGAGG